MKKIILTLTFFGLSSLICFGQNPNSNSNGIGSANNPYNQLYINNYLKVGKNSIWLDAASPNTSTTPDNRLFTTSGPLMINGNWPSSGSIPASLGQNTLINPKGGHVGIGTETPKAKLDVELNTTYLTVHESGLRVTYPNLFGAPPSDGTPINESIFEVREKFPASGTFNSRLIVKSNGNVGISTADPKYKLHIVNTNPTSGTAIRADAINGHIRLFETDGTGPTTNFTQIERNGDAFHIYQNDGSAYQHVLTAKMDGNVGLGTTNPTYKLHVSNPDKNKGTAIRADAINGHIRLFETDGAAPGTNFTQIERNGDAFHIYQNDGSTYQHVLTATMNGDVGIGTATPATGYKLSVKGKMIAEEITVQLYADWPDFVFAKEYELMDLSNVKSYIDKNSHLPNVPSAKEVKEGGINLGEMDAILLQKIEELTLYMIDLKEDNEQLKARVKELENTNNH